MRTYKPIGPHTQWRMGPCFWCGHETFRTGPNVLKPYTYTRDHLIPKRLRSAIWTLKHTKMIHLLTVTCCHGCNKAKGGKDPYKFARKFSLTEAQLKQIHRAVSYNGGLKCQSTNTAVQSTVTR